MNGQAPSARPDPVQVLRDTRRTLLKLISNIDAAIAASEDPAKSR